MKSGDSGAVEQHEEGTERAEESKEGANDCANASARAQERHKPHGSASMSIMDISALSASIVGM